MSLQPRPALPSAAHCIRISEAAAKAAADLAERAAAFRRLGLHASAAALEDRSERAAWRAREAFDAANDGRQ